MGGLGYAQNETLTIADSSLGGGGALTLLLMFLQLELGALNIEIARDQKASRTGAYDTFSTDGMVMKKVHYLVVKTMLLMTN